MQLQQANAARQIVGGCPHGQLTEVSSSQAWAQPPGNLLARQFFMNSGSTVSRCHQLQAMHSASVSRLTRRAARSRLGVFEPWPLRKMIFLNPW